MRIVRLTLQMSQRPTSKRLIRGHDRLIHSAQSDKDCFKTLYNVCVVMLYCKDVGHAQSIGSTKI